jgi:Fe-S-cluster containining protein
MTLSDPDLPACAGCGVCCHLLVELQEGDDDVPRELLVEHSGVVCMEQHGDGACVALDPVTRRCTIYDRRPQVCRQFERGSDLCRQVLSRRRPPPLPASPRDA